MSLCGFGLDLPCPWSCGDRRWFWGPVWFPPGVRTTPSVRVPLRVRVLPEPRSLGHAPLAPTSQVHPLTGERKRELPQQVLNIRNVQAPGLTTSHLSFHLSLRVAAKVAVIIPILQMQESEAQWDDVGSLEWYSQQTAEPRSESITSFLQSSLPPKMRYYDPRWSSLRRMT